MGTVHYYKLVRDKIPEIIRNAGKEPVVNKISAQEMNDALDNKLREETEEYIESHSIEEIADILEVLHGIAHHLAVSWDDIEKLRLQKREERGGFEEGTRLLDVISE